MNKQQVVEKIAEMINQKLLVEKIPVEEFSELIYEEILNRKTPEEDEFITAIQCIDCGVDWTEGFCGQCFSGSLIKYKVPKKHDSVFTYGGDDPVSGFWYCQECEPESMNRVNFLSPGVNFVGTCDECKQEKIQRLSEKEEDAFQIHEEE
jgi:hypothetical protein